MLKTTGSQRESPGMLLNTVLSRDDTRNVHVSTIRSFQFQTYFMKFQDYISNLTQTSEIS